MNTVLAKCLWLLLIVLLGLNAHVFPPPQYQQLDSIPFFFSESDCPHLTLQLSAFIQNGNEPALMYSYFNKILTRQFKFSECRLTQIDQIQKQNIYYTVRIFYDQKQPKEGYHIRTTEKQCIIKVSTYAGYVYALETLSQIIDGSTVLLGQIMDEPIVEYRGIMIDSVRHFIGFQYIEKLIIVMPITKLNMLHWHLSDDQAFVLELMNHPEMAKQGAYDEESFYSLNQIKYLLALAKQNAVNIIPEFDTPGHVRAWGLPTQWQQHNITVLCPKGQGYNHQFDLSKPEVFTLVEEVLMEIAQIFKDSPYLHLGGDEVFGSCWDRRPEIKDFMAEHNISSYGQLQVYWRNQLKSKLPGRTVMFWRNDAADLETFPEDILHFWGAQADTAKIVANSTSKLVLSPSDVLYINKGQSFIWQNTTGGQYSTWRQIYERFTVFPPGVNKDKILGAEVCLWGQVSNEDTFQNNLWTRSASFASKVWSQKNLKTHELVEGLVEIAEVLKKYGVAPSPIVPQFCEIMPEVCFSETSEAQE